VDLGGGSLQFSISLAKRNQFINGGFQASFGFNSQALLRLHLSFINPATDYTIPDGNPPECRSLMMGWIGVLTNGLDGIGSGGSTPLVATFPLSHATGLSYQASSQIPSGSILWPDIISGRLV